MTRSNLLYVLFILILLSCSSNTSTDKQQNNLDTTFNGSDSDSKLSTDTTLIGKQQYANIIRVYERLDTVYIDVDYIQFLTGDAAIEAAKKANEADTFITAEGKLDFAVPNDYFIVNESRKIRHLPLAKNCTFDLLHNPDRLHPIKDNSLKSLKIIYTDSPFILTINSEGLVINIKEVFLP
ncbi:hypothetical protein PDL71_09965 [Lacibacter sp. MH-610]|uniref:hypothetical protein n=1 Tax=Lacibacter sp. MH-610 TaxID=3020883 RepID=UPI00389199A1